MDKEATVAVLSGSAQVSASAKGEAEARTTWRQSAVVGGCTPVERGLWYFEVRCVDGVPPLGWARADAARSSSSSGGGGGGWCTGDLGEGTFVDGRGGACAGQRAHVQDGDIVGCLLDVAGARVSFTHNGAALAAPPLAPPDARGAGLVPVVRLRGSQRCVLVLDAHAFCAPLPAGARGYAEARTAALDTPAARAALGALFDGCVAAASATDADAEAADAGAVDVCDGDALLELFRAAGSTGETDPRALALLWLLDEKPRAWAVHRAAFVAAFAARGCSSKADVARVVDAELRRALGSGGSRGPAWASFYDFVFHLLAGTARSIGAETAAMAWGILGLDAWALFAPWRAFLARAQERADAAAARRAEAQGLGAAPAAVGVVGLDAWRQFPDFARAFPAQAALASYDPLDGAWNTVFDDFVESLEAGN